jgi:CHAD domain-containing protein
MMSMTPTPTTLFLNQLHIVRTSLPRLRDGNAEGIHDARVATRRIRELLRFTDARAGADLRDRFELMGRALGRVRDADVKLELLRTLESRLPAAAPVLVRLRNENRPNRTRLMRKLIKRFERIRVEQLVDGLAGDNRRHLQRFLEPSTHAWRRALKDAIAARAQAVAAAIEHATGVYFPNRTHATRIALKKLRYAMEVANETHSADVTAPLRDLKKGQEVLGELHDRQALLDGLAQAESSDEAMVAMVREVAGAELEGFHNRYLARRSRLLEIARDAQTMHLKLRWAYPSFAVASALVLSSGAYVAQRKLPAASA